MISCLNIRKSYKGEIVFNNLSFELKSGGVGIVFGRSGAGKSTLLGIVGGLIQADMGECKVNTKRIGFMFQDDRLIEWRTVRQNLEFITKGYYKKNETGLATKYWLEKLDLIAAEGKRPSEISGGMRKRLNFAKSLIIKPDLLILDEPFAFQDNEYQNLILEELIATNRQGATLLIACHDNFETLSKNLNVTVTIKLSSSLTSVLD